MRLPKTFLGLSFVALTSVAAASCADQAEGERCDQRNGNDDCESGLACVAAAKLPSLGDLKSDKHAGLCCPTTRTSSVLACASKSSFDAGASEPDEPDASSGGPDGAAEASTPAD